MYSKTDNNKIMIFIQKDINAFSVTEHKTDKYRQTTDNNIYRGNVNHGIGL